MNWRRFAKLPKTFKRHPHVWFWLFAGGLFLFLFGLLLLPLAIRWQAQRWLRQHGIETAMVKAVEFNPFSGRLAIYSVFGVKPGDKRLNLGRGEVRIQWSPLLKKRLSVSGFTLENVLIDVGRTSDGTVTIGGLTFAPGGGGPQPAPASAAGSPWQVSVGAIDLHNVSIVYREPRLQGRFDIYDAHIDPLDSARPGLLTCFSLAGGVNGGKLNVSGGTRPFAPDPATTAALRIERLPLAWLGGLLQGQQVAGLGGQLDVNSGLKFHRAPQTGLVSVDTLSTVSLRNLRARAPQGELGNLTMRWSGRVAASGADVKVAGALGLADLKARLAQGLEVAQSELGWRGEVALGPQAVHAAGEIRARQLEVNDPAHRARLALDEMALQSARVDMATTGTAPVRIDAGLRLKGLKADLAAQGLAAAQRELAWTGTVAIARRPRPAVQVNGNVTVLGLGLDDRANSSTLVRVGSFALRDAAVGLAGSSLKAGGRIEAGDLKGTLAAQGLDFAQSRLAWRGVADYDLTSGSLRLTTELTGDGLSLRDRRKDVRLVNLKQFALRDAAVDLTGLNAAPRLAFSGRTHMASLRARLPEPPLSITQDDLDWKGRVTVAAGKTASISHEGDLAASGIVVEDRAKGLNVLDLGELALTGARFKSPADVEVGKVRLGFMRALERPLRQLAFTTQTHTLSLRDLTLAGLSFDGRSLGVDSISAGGMACVMVRGRDGALEMQTWTGRPAAPGPEPPAQAKPAVAKTKTRPGSAQPAGEPLRVRIGRIELAGDNRFLFRDVSMNPSVQIVLRPINLSLADLDSARPDRASPLTLTTRAGRYSNIRLEGMIAPLAAAPTATLAGRIEAVDLSPFTPYTQRYIGYRLASGTLSLATDVNLDRGVLKSKNDLALHMFELEKLKAGEMDALSTQLGYPINTALAMLRDGSGDIRLKIPVDGNLNDPKVGVMGVILKALLNGATNSIRSAVNLIYAPLGAVVSVGEKIAGQGSVLQCNPVVFAAGGRDLAADARPYLDKVAATMRARPGLRLSLTGIGTTADAAALPAVDAETTGTRASEPGALAKTGRAVLGLLGKPEKPESTRPLPKEQLLRLGNRRASAVMDYLVKQAQIKPDRIFRRAPTVDEAVGAKPRVEVSF